MNPTDLNEYRQRLIKVLTQARELAVQQIQAAQQKYKKQYDRYTSTEEYREGDWILIRFPSDESGKQRKLSRPWHGPYRVVASTPTGVSANKILMTRTQYKFIYIGSLGAPQVFQPGIFGMEISVKDPGDHLKNYIIQRENQISTMTMPQNDDKNHNDEEACSSRSNKDICEDKVLPIINSEDNYKDEDNGTPTLSHASTTSEFQSSL